VPKLWDQTVNAHRRQVRDAILDAAASLIQEHGHRVTMAQIAEHAGIGRATLYKYFPDIEAILHAWHARQVIAHLGHLADIRDQTTGPQRRLVAVLQAYAVIIQQTRQQHDMELGTLLHQDEHLAHARQSLHLLIRELIVDAAAGGHVRGDIPPDELAGYAINALNAAAGVASRAGVHRLVQVTVAGLRPPNDP
jgi:AcrR family transcriptional regulator